MPLPVSLPKQVYPHHTSLTLYLGVVFRGWVFSFAEINKIEVYIMASQVSKPGKIIECVEGGGVLGAGNSR